MTEEMSHPTDGTAGRRAPTLRDVSRVAGVSMTTASRALARRGDLSASTRARVASAAESLGYHRSWTKQGRPPAHPRNVTLIVGHVGGWADRVVQGAWRSAGRLGFDLDVKLDRPGQDEDWSSRISTSRAAGVVFGLIQPLRADVLALHESGLPVVVVGPISKPDVTVHRVETTDWEGGYLAGEHLVGRGANSFISVLGRPAYPFGRARDEGFRAAIGALAPRAELRRITTAWTESGPIAELTGLLAVARRPLAIFACNDAMALRCYESASAAGVRVGEDVLVVGFDDGPHAAAADPPLTTLHQPLEAMAALAVEIIAGSARSADPRIEHPALPVHLVERASTSLPRLDALNPRR